MLESFRDQLCANAAIAAAMQAATLHHEPHGPCSDDMYGSGPDHDAEDDEGEDDTNQRKRKHDPNASAQAWAKPGRGAAGGKATGGSTRAATGKDGICRNQTGYIGVRQRKWGMFAAEIRDGDKRRWLGSFNSGRDAGLAYDAAAISQKGCKAKTNFRYSDFMSCPRQPCEAVDVVRWDLLPKDIAERFPIPANPCGNGAREEFDSAPPSRGGRAAGRGVDQQANDAAADAAEAQEQQPTKRSRSSSFGAPPALEHAAAAETAARQNAAPYLPQYEVHGGYAEEGHLPPPAYYAYPPGTYMRHPSEEIDDPEYEAAAAAYHQQYMLGPQMHGGHPGSYQVVTAYREPSGGSSQPSSSTLCGTTRDSPRGGALPAAASARVVASAASRAAAIAAYEMERHSYMAAYPMHYAPKGYRAASGRGCTGSDGGMRPDYPPAYIGHGGGAGGRPRSDGGRSCEEGGGGSSGRHRTSEESLPLASLGLEGGDAGADGASFDVSMEGHALMMQYADQLGPYAGYEHPGMMMGHPGSHHVPADYRMERGRQHGGEIHPMQDFMLPGADEMSGHGYHPAGPYRYLQHHEYESEAVGDADEAEAMAAGWQGFHHHHHHHHHQAAGGHAEEMEALASLQHITQPSSMNPVHALEGAHAIVAAAAAAAAAAQQQEEEEGGGDVQVEAKVCVLGKRAAT